MGGKQLGPAVPRKGIADGADKLQACAHACDKRQAGKSHGEQYTRHPPYRAWQVVSMQPRMVSITASQLHNITAGRAIARH